MAKRGIAALVVILGAPVLTACGEEPFEPEAGGCNGAVALCSRRYDQVSYPTSHNSFSQLGTFVYANQDEDLPKQLADGVRAIMLDTYWHDDAVRLCHMDCSQGSTLAIDVLGQVRLFLEQNRREVLTIILENYVKDRLIEAVFAAAGLSRWLYRPTGDTWPTLQHMIDADTRLVVFTDKNGGRVPWLLPQFHYMYESHGDIRTVEGLDNCDLGRGAPSGGLFYLTHYTTNGTGSIIDASRANTTSVLLERALRCQRELGQLPNFVAVDYYDHGAGLFESVRTLNGL